MKVLVTRPEPGASATAAKLEALGHEAILAPSLTIRPVAARLPAAPAALIITSGQAVPCLPPAFSHVPVFCVGDATAGRLRAAGFPRVESARGDAEDLFRLVTARKLAGLHVMAVGERHGIALAQRLRAAGLTVTRRKVYAAKPVRAIPAQALAALAAGEVNAALFYSAESARAFVRLSPPGTQAMIACALSSAVAGALCGLPWASIRVAVAPSEADMMALLA
ncbi:MAG: uroporphyrinogen-III synthase [Acidocella sp.]|nr:uroporphyrinogen-III synthase [Acidocella sp.]